MKKNKIIPKGGFTFIEMVITITIVALVLPVLFAMLFSIVQAQLKVYRLTQVKREGDFLLNSLETNLRNSAVYVYSDTGATSEICSSSAPSEFNNWSDVGAFKDKFGNTFSYSVDSSTGKAASASSIGPTTTYLTSGNTVITNARIQCMRRDYFTDPTIKVNFTISWNTNGVINTSPQEAASLTYQTLIKLRNSQ